MACENVFQRPLCVHREHSVKLASPMMIKNSLACFSLTSLDQYQNKYLRVMTQALPFDVLLLRLKHNSVLEGTSTNFARESVKPGSLLVRATRTNSCQRPSAVLRE